jgi:hypothetical protein
LTEVRYLSFEYLLRRAALSDTKSEKVAWWSVWAIQAFVERLHRFPRQGELYPYLHDVLDESKTFEGLKLPPLVYTKEDSPGEAQRSLLEYFRQKMLPCGSKFSSYKGVLLGRRVPRHLDELQVN